MNKKSIQLRGEDIEGVEQFTYLGSVVSRDSGTDQDIKSRIEKATAAFKTLRPIWTSQVISVKTKLRIFNSNVKSVVLNVCETWRITKASTHKVQTFINRCLRAILHIIWQDKITNEEIWRRTGQAQAEAQIKRRKLAGPHPAKFNVQRGTPCSKMEPTRETEERKIPLHLGKVCGD